MAGYAKANNSRLHEFLRKEYGPQRDIADLFGLKDHSAISKNAKNRALTPDQPWLVMFAYPDEFIHIAMSQDIREEAKVEGYLEAFSRVRERDLKDPTYRERMTREEYEYVRRVLASKDWADAQLEKDHELVQIVGLKLLDCIHAEIGGQCRVTTLDDIAGVVRAWGVSFLLCIDTMASHFVL